MSVGRDEQAKTVAPCPLRQLLHDIGTRPSLVLKLDAQSIANDCVQAFNTTDEDVALSVLSCLLVAGRALSGALRAMCELVIRDRPAKAIDILVRMVDKGAVIPQEYVPQILRLPADAKLLRLQAKICPQEDLEQILKASVRLKAADVAFGVCQRGAKVQLIPNNTLRDWLVSPSFGVACAAVELATLVNEDTLSTLAVRTAIRHASEHYEALVALRQLVNCSSGMRAALNFGATDFLLDILAHSNCDRDVCACCGCLACLVVAPGMDTGRILSLLVPSIEGGSLSVRMHALSVVLAAFSKPETVRRLHDISFQSSRDGKRLASAILRAACYPMKEVRITAHAILRAASLPPAALLSDVLGSRLVNGVVVGCVWARFIAKAAKGENCIREAMEAIGGFANSAIAGGATVRWTIIALLCDAAAETASDTDGVKQTALGLIRDAIDHIVAPLLDSALATPCCALLTNLLASDATVTSPEAASPLTPSAPLLRDGFSWSIIVREIGVAICARLLRGAVPGLFDVLLNIAIWSDAHDASILDIFNADVVGALKETCNAPGHESNPLCPRAHGVHILALLARGPVPSALSGLQLNDCVGCTFWCHGR